jgi:hypothetical protein
LLHRSDESLFHQTYQQHGKYSINSKPHQITKSETGFSHSPLKYRAIVGKNMNAAYADTAPEAICKAALLAVMEGKDEES